MGMTLTQIPLLILFLMVVLKFFHAKLAKNYPGRKRKGLILTPKYYLKTKTTKGCRPLSDTVYGNHGHKIAHGVYSCKTIFRGLCTVYYIYLLLK